MVHQHSSSLYLPLHRMCYVSKKTRKGLMAFSIAILVFALLAYYYVMMHSTGGVARIGPMYIDVNKHKLALLDKNDDTLIDIHFAVNIVDIAIDEECSSPEKNSVCFWWKNTTGDIERAIAELRVKVHDPEPEEKNVQCVDVKWNSLMYDYPPTDCVLFNHKHTISKPHWYGGGEIHDMQWPMENIDIPMKPFVSQDLMQMREPIGSVIERYWLNSLGVAVLVDEETPLHVSVNEKNSEEMCFKSQYINSPYQNPEQKYPTLKYTLCVGKDMRTTHEFVINKYFAHPKIKEVPDERMFQYPIWSTWARYKVHVNQSSVLQYAKEIRDHGFNNSQIEIDDMYTTSHGEYNFVLKKFPNAREMVSDLKKMGFRVTTWVHPFANIDSPAFIEGTEKGYWLKDPTGRVPALVTWWNGVAAVLDTSNVDANNWYVERLMEFRDIYGIDSFKFDAGEAQYLPINYNASVPFSNPNLYCTKYVQTAERLGRQIEVRCGHKSQKHHVFVRMMDKDSNWNYSNGLLTMIPSTLVMGLLGYPYILPDMIGGNCYDSVTFHSRYLPDRELYIRWLELTAYLPAMQFSVAPWQYQDNDDVVRIAKEMTSIHADVVTPLVMELINDSVEKASLQNKSGVGFPIIRPLWWIAPKDTQAQTIDSQFLVGDTLLVAPVLKKNARKRDIYLPEGRWRDNLNSKTVEGGRWIRDHRVCLDEVATFTNMKSDRADKLHPPGRYQNQPELPCESFF
ncbi:LOW QUALITY PROTEIN: myogenesis-regulating glycosidase-like [Amphiura filiformis]|uniref:LOW QUALITY PROTEIN: myogenesis-regulating glycosidase-like n=1 Tax=Amphiura filiformis TaxID=82378 RepID=UPI003B22806F